ncbi:hypothetical protein PVAND_010616 [Polypedilum vanderplanki]|uniref:Nuclear envelope integral membrane protein 1 n=1 Tax=Polypedilum vanderplanki TaxID=319348 RepID=A0A9J6CGH8_POLVA|nr:hypothetical protein PVAND_010616 [Polypedilum vanderplanki]
MAKNCILYVICFAGLSQLFFIAPVLSSTAVYKLDAHSHIHVLPEIGSFGYAKENMNIFCYKGIEKDISQLLKSVTLNINIDEDDFTCYHGSSVDEVKTAQESHKSIFSFNIFSHSKKKNVKLNPFNDTCIGIETAQEYIVTIQTIKLDLLKLGLLIGGLFFFFLSSKLSNNSAFYYLCGILLGVFASVLVLIWFISKLFPKKPLMYGALISGWALVAYISQILYENIQPLLILYRKYVIIYILTTSIISFGVCYYTGPPKNQRTKRLIMWTIQLFSLIAIYCSSDFFEATMSIIAITILTYYAPFRKMFKLPSLRRFWHRIFPPKPKLITMEEYNELGRRETEKALKELREYVRSPDCKQWKVVMNLSQPTRFASFVEGDSHITMDETRNYENTFQDLSDDDDDDSEVNEIIDSSSDDSDLVEESIAVDKSLNIINKSRLANIKNTPQLKINKTSTPITNGGMIRRGTSRNVSRAFSNKSMKSDKNRTYELSEDDD